MISKSDLTNIQYMHTSAVYHGQRIYILFKHTWSTFFNWPHRRPQRKVKEIMMEFTCT